MAQTKNVRGLTLLLMVTKHQQQVGRAMRQKRREMELSPRDFANALNVSAKTLERWERGETNGAIANIDKVAEVLETTPAELMATKTEPTPDLVQSLNGDTPDHTAQLDRIEQRLQAIENRLATAAKGQAEVVRAARQTLAQGRKRASRAPRARKQTGS